MKLILVVIGVVLIAAGPAGLLAPDAAAAGYGIPADSTGARSYLLAAGVRDAALGIWLLALLWLGADRRMLALSLLSIAVVAAGDAAIVLAHGGDEGTRALLVHVTALSVLLFLSGWLWFTRLGRQPKLAQREGI